MSRKVLGLDRFLTFLLGLVLLVGGAAAIAWWGGWAAQVFPAWATGSAPAPGTPSAPGGSPPPRPRRRRSWRSSRSGGSWPTCRAAAPRT